jgi:hypothetical protein
MKKFFVIAAFAASVNLGLAAEPVQEKPRYVQSVPVDLPTEIAERKAEAAKLENPLKQDEPQVLEKFTVTGTKLPLALEFVEIYNPAEVAAQKPLKNPDQMLSELEGRVVGGAGNEITLMRMTWSQWQLLEVSGVKLASLSWSGDIAREWIEMKFGNLGPILSAVDGLPGFVFKDKQNALRWTYDREGVSKATVVFWVAIDPVQTEREAQSTRTELLLAKIDKKQ